MNELVIKTYDIDYSFIIKNYLDKELWDKEWTLFVYKDFVFSLQLWEINTRSNSVTFEILLTNNDYKGSVFRTYYIKQSNINILKKQINGAMYDLITYCENYYIRNENGYKTIQEAESEEIDMLTEIAEKFLDENGVSNKEIRDVYIDNYVLNNKKTDIYLSNYLGGRTYLVLSDLYLVYTKITEDENKYNAILSKIKASENYMEILAEANDYLNKLKNEEKREELEVEFKECLEAI